MTVTTRLSPAVAAIATTLFIFQAVLSVAGSAPAATPLKMAAASAAIAR
jgi:hypothetical protein